MNNKNRTIIKVLLIALAFVVAGIIYSCSMGQKPKKEQNAVTVEPSSEAEETQTEEEQTHTICVHVCGSVVTPGVYYLSEGARVHEAVELAGGLLEDADSEYVNLAQIAEDGSRIYIPSKEEVEAGDVPEPESAESRADEGLVNINTASLDELKTLPGIGDIKARAIISYRERAGSFSSVEDIMNVAGIKAGSYEKIKEFIKV